MSLKKLMPKTNVNHNIQKIKITNMYNPNQVSNLVPFVEQRPVKVNKTRVFQEGGEAPTAPEQAPQEQGGSPEEMAGQIVEQILQSVQDPNVIAMIAQMLMEAVQGGGQEQAMPEEQPAMRNGGVLNLKFAKGGLAAKMKKGKMKMGGKAC
jgi:hypothetical protein